jgi:signal transduction histidine kinase
MRKTMDRHQDGKVDFQETEIREAVTDFAQFALQMNGSAAGSASQVATLLLQRLLLLCQAQQGALFVTREEPQVTERQAMFVASNRKVPQIMALYEIGEEEAYRRLFSCLSAALPTAALKTALDTPCWALCHLPTSVPPLEHEEEASQGSLPPLLSDGVWFLFGWSGSVESEAAGACEALYERAQSLLARLAMSAGAASLSLLQAERIQELEMVTYTESVREMELLKAELLATVSHELRSPLASIKGYASTLLRHERRISAQERHEFLLAIQQASDRLQFIVERFLQMSQLETESVKLSPSLIDLVRLAQEAMGVIEARVAGQEPERFTFRMHVRDAGGQPATGFPLIKADPRLLREMLDHLLENAVSYSPQGGLIEVLLRAVPASSLPGGGPGSISRVEPAMVSQEGLSRTDHTRTEGRQPQEMVEICVRDRGMGIASEHLERIFERFYRVDTALTRPVGGLGLGLAICKRIIELHQGTIWAENRPGGGSVFCVRLPISHEQASLQEG